MRPRTRGRRSPTWKTKERRFSEQTPRKFSNRLKDPRAHCAHWKGSRGEATSPDPSTKVPSMDHAETMVSATKAARSTQEKLKRTSSPSHWRSGPTRSAPGKDLAFGLHKSRPARDPRRRRGPARSGAPHPHKTPAPPSTARQRPEAHRSCSRTGAPRTRSDARARRRRRTARVNLGEPERIGGREIAASRIMRRRHRPSGLRLVRRAPALVPPGPAELLDQRQGLIQGRRCKIRICAITSSTHRFRITRRTRSSCSPASSEISREQKPSPASRRCSPRTRVLAATIRCCSATALVNWPVRRHSKLTCSITGEFASAQNYCPAKRILGRRFSPHQAAEEASPT